MRLVGTRYPKPVKSVAVEKDECDDEMKEQIRKIREFLKNGPKTGKEFMQHFHLSSSSKKDLLNAVCYYMPDLWEDNDPYHKTILGLNDHLFKKG